jgi:hypothetical protein
MFINNKYKTISKIRTSINMIDYKIEVDNFIDIKLVMMEIEVLGDNARDAKRLVNMIKVPDVLLPFIISEVTGNKEFDNFNLCLNINKEELVEKQNNKITIPSYLKNKIFKK